MLRAFGFIGSAGLRLVGAAGFAAIALVGVLVIERGGDPPAITAPTATTAPVSGRLVLETTFPVARWTVQVAGRPVADGTATAQRWEAPLSGDPATVFVQAEGEDATSSAPVALRWSFAGAGGILWGEGAVAGTLGTAGAR